MSFCFPCTAYELRLSLDLALLTKWPVFLLNASGNPNENKNKLFELNVYLARILIRFYIVIQVFLRKMLGTRYGPVGTRFL